MEIDTRGAFTDDLKNIGGGNLVNTSARMDDPYPPYILIRPGGRP